MRKKALCFPSPFGGGSDSELLRFVWATDAERYNPWPELLDTGVDAAGESFLLHGWCNPLIRLWYAPTLEYRLSLDALPLDLRMMLLHEPLHTAFDFTPAKECARTCLATLYGWLQALLFEFESPGDAWDGGRAAALYAINYLSDALGEISRSLLLGEELLVTALTCWMASCAYPDEDEAVGLLEVDGISSQSRNLWPLLRDSYESEEAFAAEFQELYFGFLWLVRLLGQDTLDDNLLARAASYLQPIRPAGEGPQAVDCRDRCLRLAETAQTLCRGRELGEWLDQQMRESPDEVAWQAVLERALLDAREPGYMDDLWALSRNERLNRWRGQLGAAEARKAAATIREELWNGTIRLVRDGTFERLIPVRVGKRWYIDVLDYRDPDPAPATSLVFMDGLRQQLVSGVGVRCPNYSGGECVCERRGDPRLKRGMQRFAKWAHEDRFGPGNWTPLPAPCGRRD